MTRFEAGQVSQQKGTFVAKRRRGGTKAPTEGQKRDVRIDGDGGMSCRRDECGLGVESAGRLEAV